jgi:hypothetical protein
LSFVNATGITGTWNAATGTLTLSGTASVADYQAALRAVKYANISDAPNTAPRTLSYTVSDSALTSNTVTATVSVAAVNDAPVLGNSASLAYVENQAASAVHATIAVSDVDNGTLAGATVTISNGYVAGQDVLSFVNATGITGTWNAATGTLTLSGTASVADYQAALRAVKYANLSDAPNTAPRTLSYTVSDGALNSNTVTATVSVAAVNDAPVLDDSRTPYLTGILEDTLLSAGDTVASIIADGSITDPDLTSAPEAIVLTGISGNGQWQYSVDGVTWTSVGTVSDGHALLLDPTNRLHFIPAADWYGTATVTFRAWDKTQGQAGQYWDASQNGGTSAFSQKSDTASITVTDIGDKAGSTGALIISNEVQINNHTTFSQTSPSVTVQKNGTRVHVWQSDDQDGYGWGIYARLVAADGAQGPDLRLNSYTTGNQYQPQVTALAGGGFVAVWTSVSQDGSSEGVYARRFDADGVAQGNEVLVNTTTYNTQWEPSVASLTDGGYVVLWSSYGQDGSYSGIYGQRYAANSTPLGGEFQLNTYTAYTQYQSQVAALPGGGFVAVWTSITQDGSAEGVYFRRYAANGTALDSSEYLANLTTYNTQWLPAVTVLADGGFVIAWSSYGQDESYYGIYARSFNADGSAKGGEFRINSYTSSTQTEVALTALADGGFVAVWQSDNQDGSGLGIYGQRYAANGTPLGDEFQISQTTYNDQSLPAVAATPDGGFVVSWSSYGQDGSYFGIFSRTYSAGHLVATGGTVATGDSILASALIAEATLDQTALPTQGFAAAYQRFMFEDLSSGGGYFTVNGIAQTGAFEVTAAQLGAVRWIAGSTESSDTYRIQAYDGSRWTGWSAATVKTANMQLNGRMLVGGASADFLTGMGGDDWLEGRGGNDTLMGGAGSDTYYVTRGGGMDTIVQTDLTDAVTTTDRLQFGSGINYDQLWFRHSGNDLLIDVIGESASEVVLKNWYLDTNCRVDIIRTDGGMQVTAASLENLVQAMAGMTTPSQGELTLSTIKAQQLDTVLAANWKSS